ncbi:PLAC8 motif-containing protein [Arabidopsis thaliana x Arabidopsis arenosa]|uniref:Protein PLANT CADMIUM RESISTANCE 10 n=3 Tax=Arabidopsis TaxID=3701 RepID=A0A178VWJ5_ARATH|nr:PLAC8 family protein [Arabidopsis thaliana]NP_001324509.1 PLAC8 family protein [Arabidopsis thaliana]NP_850339.1 PLAC8 family protein [Arabidopsis thaliana]KAG7639263.1 PLAC8 motif-containing protein [Arabidopsis thaliana x Arabidopsis arenosa]AEC09901.1 PLAC8 family protein [Arabidopsis thaliana]ANM62344.1 PLAC8 family protein [Arabidopsis thaliana]ANM62348.1 PLAC8 family protein [Arabidopsis thaliana]KAG7639265.1 PLAC8 motif-containing protein [Arabidopsis thaliana x Arabidopsis arenosa|eukprot:NP_001324506.1 PLAC8 family protein [Arabidopsis thaliana]
MVIWYMRLLRRYAELYATTLCHPNLLHFTTRIKFVKGCVGLFCPCYIFGKNAELLGSGTFAGPCLTHCISWALVNTICCFATNGALLGLPGCFVSCYACGYRKSLRAKYNLQEAPCGDFVTHFFCHLCAICQEYREIREQSSGSYPLDMKMAITNAPLAQTMESAN